MLPVFRLSGRALQFYQLHLGLRVTYAHHCTENAVTFPHSRYHSPSHTFQLLALRVRIPERRKIPERRIVPNGLRRRRSIAQ